MNVQDGTSATVHSLPVEILGRIFKQIPSRQYFNTLKRVCRLFRDVISETTTTASLKLIIDSQCRIMFEAHNGSSRIRLRPGWIQLQDQHCCYLVKGGDEDGAALDIIVVIWNGNATYGTETARTPWSLADLMMLRHNTSRSANRVFNIAEMLSKLDVYSIAAMVSKNLKLRSLSVATTHLDLNVTKDSNGWLADVSKSTLKKLPRIEMAKVRITPSEDVIIYDFIPDAVTTLIMDRYYASDADQNLLLYLPRFPNLKSLQLQHGEGLWRHAIRTLFLNSHLHQITQLHQISQLEHLENLEIGEYIEIMEPGLLILWNHVFRMPSLKSFSYWHELRLPVDLITDIDKPFSALTSLSYIVNPDMYLYTSTLFEHIQHLGIAFRVFRPGVIELLTKALQQALPMVSELSIKVTGIPWNDQAARPWGSGGSNAWLAGWILEGWKKLAVSTANKLKSLHIILVKGSELRDYLTPTNVAEVLTSWESCFVPMYFNKSKVHVKLVCLDIPL